MGNDWLQVCTTFLYLIYYKGKIGIIFLIIKSQVREIFKIGHVFMWTCMYIFLIRKQKPNDFLMSVCSSAKLT